MKKGKLLLATVTVVAFLSSMTLANGLNLNGLGARAVAMGGAFVGLADDFSTVFWNPAGAAQFEKKYFGFSGFALLPSMSYQFDLGPVTMVDAEAPSKVYPGGLAAYYHPINDKLVAGISVYSPSGLGVKWDGADFANISGPPNFAPNPNIKWESLLFMVTAAPSLAYKLSDQVSLGVVLNANYTNLDLAMYAGSVEPFPGVHVDMKQQDIHMSGWGIGATIGILAKPSDMFSIGATLRTPVKFNLSGDATITGIPQLGLNETSDIETEITWPLWAAVGVAFRPIEQFVLTFDVQYTDWNTIDVLEISFIDPAWEQMMALSGENEMDFHWERKIQIRVGAEYMVTDTLALRAGYYYDPTPSPDSTLNVLLPSATFNVITGGFGYSSNGLQFDFAVEYVMGKEREVPFLNTVMDPEWESAMPGIHGLNVLSFDFSVGYRW
ncbi:MAG: outer membrane protein transport protein [Candidatus Aminicenantes bacterium]|nr:MAG: outer membrane protein transport protein [Candidatus Aminicenantes bacterium]